MRNLLSQYELPFGRTGTEFSVSVVKDRSIAPTTSIYSGLRLKVLTGSSQEFEQGGSTSSAGAILVCGRTIPETVSIAV